jgi:hypothetical protein
MKGVQYVVDDQGEKRAVLIDLKINKELWEDFYDAALAEQRAEEPRRTLEEVKEQLNDSE